MQASPPYPATKPPVHYDGAYSPPPNKYPIRGGPGMGGMGPGGMPGGPPPFDEDAYGRSARYRELPPHRMPQYEDEILGKVIFFFDYDF